MKKNLYSILLFTAAGVAFNTQGADGEINITGELFVATCNLHIDSANMTVPLGNIQRSALNTTGATSQEIPFTLKFTDCALGTTMYITFMGTATASDDSAFALDNPGQASTAQNVGLKIVNQWGNAEKPNYNNSGTSANTAGDFSRKYTAAYKALNNNIIAGDASVTIEYNVKYM